MKKQEQAKINEKVLQAYDEFLNEYCSVSNTLRIICENRFKSCSADYGETENYLYLRSYNTIVCFIDKRTSQAYDVLRFVYGYTATSAQHIAKFCNWAYAGIKHTYYPV